MTNFSNKMNELIPIKKYDNKGNIIADLVKNQEGIYEYNSEKSFIVPPGLIKKMQEFHALIETSQGRPVLITGPTGVGKSLFLHMYCEWYKKKHGENSKIITVNCSHFEKQFARSELFGHIKGSFTGATENKKGWIEVADGGLLILDEIGELPDECQAQLLTFIEDGKYHRVGESQIQQAKDLKIIGATNREWNQPGKQLRDDLWNRFITINIPPLYSRRGDVLYYMATKDPTIIKKLYMTDILILLSYNWPGNVREIDRFISLLKSRDYLGKINPLVRWFENEDDKFKLSKLYSFDNDYINLSPTLAHFLGRHLNEGGIDVESLNLLLNDYGTGIWTEKELIACKNFKEDDLYLKKNKSPLTFEDLSNVKFDPPPGPDKDHVYQKQYDEINNELLYTYQQYFNVKILSKYEPFDTAEMGYGLFCWLFLQDKNTYRNVFIEIINRNISTRPEFTSHTILKGTKKMTEEQKFKKNQLHRNLIEKISKQAFDYLKGEISVKTETYSSYFDEKRNFILKLQGTYLGNEDKYTTIQVEQAKQKNEDNIDIFSLTHKEFEKYYYAGLLNRYQTPRKIAELLDVKEQTMYSKFKSLKKGELFLNFLSNRFLIWLKVNLF